MIPPTRSVPFLAVSFVLLLVASAAAYTTNIVATDDAIDNNGQLVHGQTIGAGPTQRSMVEFNVAGAVPADATINSVSFKSLPLIGVGQGSISLQYSVYPGDGVASLGDSYASSAADGGYYIPNILQITASPAVVSLNLADVRAALATSSYLGIDLYKIGGSGTSSIGFESIHDTLNPGFLKPTLVVDYTPTPEPASLALLAPAILLLTTRRRK